MRRPYRALCVAVLGLAVLIGCSKKSKVTDTGAAAQAEPVAPRPVPADKPPPLRGQAAGGAQAVVPVANGGAKPDAEAVAAAPGSVELVQCGFEKVDAALAAAKGKVVLVDCWALWCGPCVSSFPKLIEKHEKYAAKGLVCVTVSVDSGRKAYTPEQVHAFLKEKKAAFQNFYLLDQRAASAALSERFGFGNSIPHAALFDKTGTKIWTGHPLSLTVAMIEAELAK